MFHVGDYIVYGSNGICRVEEITHPDIAGIDEDKLYYVLVPEKTRDSRLFCPTDNSRVVLRSVITADEAAALMDAIMVTVEAAASTEASALMSSATVRTAPYRLYRRARQVLSS